MDLRAKMPVATEIPKVRPVRRVSKAPLDLRDRKGSRVSQVRPGRKGHPAKIEARWARKDHKGLLVHKGQKDHKGRLASKGP